MPPEQRSADNVPGENGSARSRLVSIGSSDSREYPLDKQTVAIGSHPSNDVVLDDTTVSRRHATIARKPGSFELADLGSTNGTFVNGGRVRKPIALKRGDEIKFGSVRFAFIAAGDPIPAPTRAARAPSRLGRDLCFWRRCSSRDSPEFAIEARSDRPRRQSPHGFRHAGPAPRLRRPILSRYRPTCRQRQLQRRRWRFPQ